MLRLESLSYLINGKPLIDDISHSFLPGTLYGILGPNGSGKSTLLKTISGIWTPTAGKVLWNGQNLLELPRSKISRIISFVPQQQHVHFDFTVETFVAMGRYPYAKEKKNKRIDIIDQALALVDAGSFKTRPVSHLSQGERQRVYIARALVTESPVLLLDEPASCLDIRHQLEIWRLLKQLLSQGKTILVTNHDLNFTRAYCSKVAVMKNGKMAATGNFEDVIDTPLLKKVFGVTREAIANSLPFSLIHS